MLSRNDLAASSRWIPVGTWKLSITLLNILDSLMIVLDKTLFSPVKILGREVKSHRNSQRLGGWHHQVPTPPFLTAADA